MSSHASDHPEFIEDTSQRHKLGRSVWYQKGKFLGKGGFAKCYEAIETETKTVFAVKIVNKKSVQKPRANAKLKSEIAIHRTLENERVVKMYSYFEDSENVYILLELCPGQTLNDLLKRRRRFSEAETLFYMYDLIQGVRYLHRHRVLHRDLKLGNLFLDADMKLKIGDFGLAAQLQNDDEKKKTICGTPNYIAPEILEGKQGHSYEVDVWSLGVILYTCLFGRPPFETSDVKTTYRKIRHSSYTFPEAPTCSAAAKSLIQSILVVDPRKRPTLDQILSMPWFSACALPPAMPSGIRAVTPRPASARSETPERGTIEFARIDSPVSSAARLLDRPCSPRTPVAGATPTCATPKKRVGTGPPLPSARTRPPLQRFGNDENAAPDNRERCDLPRPTTGDLDRLVCEKLERMTLSDRGERSGTLTERQGSGNLLPSSDLKSSTGALSARPSTPTMGQRQRPTPHAVRRYLSHEAPASARSPKPAVSPRAAPNALRLTPRGGRTSPVPLRSRTPTTTRADSARDGDRWATMSPAHLLDALGGLTASPRQSARRTVSARGAREPTGEREAWVVQWMDYTCKYGVGYMLSDGSCGVYFNDSTKIVQPSHGQSFEYITRRQYDVPEAKSCYTFTNYPQDLHKKATLLKHFNYYMHSSEKKEGVVCGKSSIQGSHDRESTQPYVKKWMRSRHAILFQLNNKLVQVHFLVDGTELHFSSRHQVVTYVDKLKERHTYPLATILDVQSPELLKRLRYAKDMLVSLIGGRSAGATRP